MTSLNENFCNSRLLSSYVIAKKHPGRPLKYVEIIKTVIQCAKMLIRDLLSFTLHDEEKYNGSFKH